MSFPGYSEPAIVAMSIPALLVIQFLYRLLFAPLAKLPGPWYTSVSRLWIMYHEFHGDRTVTIDRLHAKYGSVVRLAPDELSFNDVESVRDIYGIKSDLGKSNFYDLFVYYNERNTFTSLTKAEHAHKKRLVADKYTKSYVMRPLVSEGIQKHAAAFMRVIQEHPICDVYVYLHYYVMDVITNHLYGAYGTHTLSESTHRPLVYDLSGEKHRTRLYLHHYFGSALKAVATVSSLWHHLLSKLSSSDALASEGFHVRGDRVSAYGKESIASFRAHQLGKDNIAACAKLFLAPDQSDTATAAECMDHLVAGVDTTGDALCVLLWKLSTPECRHFQDRLHAELQTLAPLFDTTQTAPMAALDQLPFLDAVIREGLRWRAPVPMTLFRVIPSGGRPIATSKTSAVMVPAGTVVGCQAYSLHLNADVFPDPKGFRPERWLTDDAGQLEAMRSYFWPFSSGARHCLGHNIAMVEMKILLAAIYFHYKTETTSSCTEESMAMDDQLTSGVPYGMKCVLEFKKR